MSAGGSGKSGNFIVRFYRKHMIISTLIIMAAILVFLGYFSFFFMDVWTRHGSTTTVPEVRRKSYAEAMQLLKDADLDVEIADSVYDTSLSPGQVKDIFPQPGARVKPGRTVYITINSFQPQQITVSMPLSGVSSRQAITYLESLNIRNIRIAYVPSNFPDLVEDAKYKGKSIVPGMKIPVTADVVLEVGRIPEGKRPEPTVEPEPTVDTNDDDALPPTDPEPIATDDPDNPQTPQVEE